MRCPCSRLCHSCANAVAELSLQPSPPSRSPCRHVAVALSWSCCHRALAGDRHAYTPCAVPRCLVCCRSPLASCLVGGVIRVVVAVVGGGRRAYAPCAVLVSFPAALGFAPLLASLSASSLAPLSESSSRGEGDVIVLGIIHHQCKRRLVNSRASSRLRHARTYERFVVLATSTRSAEAAA